MAKYLVIVESPAKVKTIKKFLGSNYQVVASNGHVRDLPKSSLGVDLEDDYEPKYITIRGKGDLLSSLRKEVKKADKIYLATDPDREGEAISWHLIAALKLEDKNVERISFNEITKNAVKEAMKNPRELDMNLVDSQQARRVLDRVVGYKISPLLWAKVKRGLSAGRVQSVALRIISDREREIEAFIPQEYYTLEADFSIDKNKKPLKASFYKDELGNSDINDKESLDKICKKILGGQAKVVDVSVSSREKKRPLPFTTSTMQQEASKQLNFTIQKTMSVAQQLYEGVDIKKQGTVGLITYLRTDSIRVSDEAKSAAKEFITDNYGSEYYSEYIFKGKTKGNIQDAHEAIRPSDITRTPSSVKDSLTRDQFKLYQLIWNRFMASQMSSAKYDTKNVKIDVNSVLFSASASKRTFDGFMSVYTDVEDKKEEKNTLIDKITENSDVSLVEYEEKQHFTQPPAHYTEASLVKTLEELGIGRPSTYSPIIITLLKRRYITKEGKNIFMTEIGDVVNDIMVESFPAIVDVNFTANLEMLLDGVEEGTVEWKSIMRNFYPDLKDAVEVAEKELEKVTIEDEVTDTICESCGRNMVIKYGPHGKFLACPGFPECRNTKPYLEKIGVACPDCGADIVLKKTRKGRKFYGCVNNPECEFMSWAKPVDKKCPRCNSIMIIKGKKLACNDPACGYVEDMKEED